MMKIKFTAMIRLKFTTRMRLKFTAMIRVEFTTRMRLKFGHYETKI
jgi:hypothetical protein